MDNTFNTELIEQYLKGDLPENELQNFEAQLNVDPALRSEVNLQQDIINEVNGIRKTELKNRLSAIPVSSAGLSGLQKSMMVAAASVAIVGTGIYFAVTSNSEAPLPVAPPQKTISEVDQPTVAPNLEQTKAVPLATDMVVTEETETNLAPKQAPSSNVAINEPLKSPSTTPVNPFDAIDAKMDDATIGSAGEGVAETKFANTVNISKAKNINITPQDGSGRLKYKYNGSELVLIGRKFIEHEETFTLLMDNKANDLFLSFEGEYYKIINHHNKETYKMYPIVAEEDINKLKEAE